MGESVISADLVLRTSGKHNWKLVRADLVEYRAVPPFDVVICIGVLHHLSDPEAGFNSVLDNTQINGNFHCWVYGYEGNGVVRLLVEPLRSITSRLPWWITKYFIASLLSVPVYTTALVLGKLSPESRLNVLPLWDYLRWLAARPWNFTRHIVFDQLISPRTEYIKKKRIESWLNDPRIQPGSTYIVRRNGNSWKFGGKRS